MTDVFGWRTEATSLPAPPRKEPTMALYRLRLFDGAYEVLKHVARLWGFPVHLESVNGQGAVARRWTVDPSTT